MVERCCSGTLGRGKFCHQSALTSSARHFNPMTCMFPFVKRRVEVCFFLEFSHDKHNSELFHDLIKVAENRKSLKNLARVLLLKGTHFF